MNIILFDPSFRKDLLPLAYTRPVAEFRIGILKIKEKWERILDTKVSVLTEEYLKEKFPSVIEGENILINASLLPNDNIIDEINNLDISEILFKEGEVIAGRVKQDDVFKFEYQNFEAFKSKEVSSQIDIITNLWDIFSLNNKAIKSDYDLITANRKSNSISDTNTLIAKENIFVEDGAKIECAILNATDGPIYIGKDAEVMEGAVVKGPFALCEHSAIKMSAKIYGGCTFGPYSKIGGEVSNSVVFGYSNKGHDGFLGNSVLGEWCNLGADTNNSNLKNDYGIVKLWNYSKLSFVKTGLQFCGLIMGDHSKSGINTMFNTGTVVGVNSNIFGGGFPEKFVPSFSWGGGKEFVEYRFDKAIQVMNNVMERRGLNLSNSEKDIFKHIFDITKGFRVA